MDKDILGISLALIGIAFTLLLSSLQLLNVESPLIGKISLVTSSLIGLIGFSMLISHSWRQVFEQRN